MADEKQNNGPKLSLNRKSSGNQTLSSSQGSKKVQVEVRKKRVIVDPKARKLELEQEAAAKKAEAEAQAKAEALRKDPHAKEITSMEDLAKDWGLNCEKSKHS